MVEPTDLLEWPQWLGLNRDGQAGWLPQEWSEPQVAWRYPLPGPGNAAVVGTLDFICVSGRDASDTRDIFVCLDTEFGTKYWEFSYAATGDLDYGNSPRAAALISDPYVYTLGAFGHVHCLDVESGEILWKKHLVEDFKGVRPIWGYCASPLLVDGSLILQPGGTEHSMIALDAKSGEMKWSYAGRNAAYASPILSDPSSPIQIFGFDELSMGCWDANTGQRIWEYIPKHPSDFNVPTPTLIGDQLIVSSENNGTRILGPNVKNRKQPQLLATFADRVSDTHTPIRLGRYVVAAYEGVVLLDPERGLEVVATFDRESLGENPSLIAFGDRLLIVTDSGLALLLQLHQSQLKEIGRYQIQPSGAPNLDGKSLSYPAMIDRTLIYRGPKAIVGIRW